jgi:hypothetical protein
MQMWLTSKKDLSRQSPHSEYFLHTLLLYYSGMCHETVEPVTAAQDDKLYINSAGLLKGNPPIQNTRVPASRCVIMTTFFLVA